MTMQDFPSPHIEAAFAALPDQARGPLLTVRSWIIEIAGGREDIGTLIEELKWGQPSYATRPKTGCPLRLGMPKDGKTCALYVPCQTKLIAEMRAHYQDTAPANLSFEGNRGLHFDPAKPLPDTELRHAIALGLTYHSRRKN
ncbi:DUF1801 domain-containing protein [Cohaesibacter celericrescens]|uniref:YdhG-like domain-containing protein n=1 Tax=Cohaesibacter celericrescens TaxID=2067669 RepID=A0A2N5XUJ5_9HYPH|nr:DUF1801 domain-containing protein [Cohaesibacter celericrescens]PLW78183.1 hypothetical protein C0081_05950 [Cohaesibacter celericrescens]